MDFTGILVQLVYIAIFVGIALFALDQYRLWRERWVEVLRKDGRLPKPKGAAESGTNGKGELSTAAKYAIWNYMFSLFAVGGTIIGIVSGIAGYMIKDLATERAIQTALNKMQEPLSSQLDKFADANAALKVAAERINDSKTFPKAVADDLVARYPEKLRGERGSDGKNGVDGKDGKDGLPGKDGAGVAEVVAALMQSHSAALRGKDGVNGKDGKDGSPGKEGPSAAEVAAILMRSYAAELRGKDGSNGKDGVNGKDGKDGLPGKDGPSAAEVAAVLTRSYAAELRGKDGSNGKDGVNGKNGKDGLPGKDGPSAAEVATVLVMSHAAELHGRDGSNGRDGTNGNDGVNGKDGVSHDAGEIADLVFNRYREQLRGAPGKDGTNGSNGQSPKPAEVAAALWESHRDEISRQRESRKRPR
ncbi:hypothetical protein [Bradyrhizobium sp. LMTR 3]|uniref:hypothetical protein n=1 Tax=Bradyrhizobium sp. LMTR 3 TaxID=189873 RepID=UPI0008109C1A|nr:hypothetical protein [Bradyrhizobium sp. LMTR 3]OCK58812.1 hypothetical protein LMTR3_32110 [Bradyrhizobium sp. LMTR 3]